MWFMTAIQGRHFSGEGVVMSAGGRQPLCMCCIALAWTAAVLCAHQPVELMVPAHRSAGSGLCCLGVLPQLYITYMGIGSVDSSAAFLAHLGFSLQVLQEGRPCSSSLRVNYHAHVLLHVLCTCKNAYAYHRQLRNWADENQRRSAADLTCGTCGTLGCEFRP